MRTRTQWLPATLAGVAMWLSATSAHTSAAPAPAEQQAAPPQAAAVSSSEQTPAAPTPPDAPTPPEAQGAPPQATARERLSLNLQNVETRAALQLIADFADVNLVVADGVSGTVALRLRDISWDEALDVILASNGLGKRQRGNVLLVAPAEALASHEKMALESGRALAELAPLATEFIRIRYADAATLAALFDAETGAFARSERGRVLVDARTNALVVSETRGQPRRDTRRHRATRRSGAAGANRGAGGKRQQQLLRAARRALGRRRTSRRRAAGQTPEMGRQLANAFGTAKHHRRRRSIPSRDQPSRRLGGGLGGHRPGHNQHRLRPHRPRFPAGLGAFGVGGGRRSPRSSPARASSPQTNAPR